MKSILQNEKECYFCENPLKVHDHHIYEGEGRREISEKHGFKVFLCPAHHNMSDKGVHFEHVYDLLLKRLCQCQYEKMGHSREEFIRLIGRNYL